MQVGSALPLTSGKDATVSGELTVFAEYPKWAGSLICKNGEMVFVTLLITIVLNLACRMMENTVIDGLCALTGKICGACWRCKRRKKEKKSVPRWSAITCQSGHVMHLYADCYWLKRVQEDRKREWRTCDHREKRKEQEIEELIEQEIAEAMGV